MVPRGAPAEPHAAAVNRLADIRGRLEQLGAALFAGEIDVSLVASIPGLAPTIVALDRLSGPAASTVRNGECLRWTRPSAPGQLVVKSVAGGGVIAGLLFVK